MKRMIFDKDPLLDQDDEPIIQMQSQHIRKFNSLGKVMASCADYYAAIKSGDTLLIKNIQMSLNNCWIITSDRVVYDKNSAGAKIVSHYGSQIIHPSAKRIVVPHRRSDLENLESILTGEQGLLCVRTLLNTSDSADEIKNTLAMINVTELWTPDQNDRRNTRARVVIIGYGVKPSKKFIICSYAYLSHRGSAYGMRYE